MPTAIEKLKKTRWWKPAVRKYAEHLIAHRRQKSQSESMSFQAFAVDILAMPEHLRDDLFNVEEPEAAELARLQNAPRVRYRQYDLPTPAEQKIGTVMKPKKKGKKCGFMSQTSKRSRARRSVNAAPISSSPKLKQANRRRSTPDSKS